MSKGIFDAGCVFCVIDVVMKRRSEINSICRLCGTSEGIRFKIFDPGRDYVSKIHKLLPIMVRGMSNSCIASFITSNLRSFSNHKQILTLNGACISSPETVYLQILMSSVVLKVSLLPSQWSEAVLYKCRTRLPKE